MTSYELTADEVLLVVKKYPDKPLFIPDYENVRDVRSKGKSKNVTYYIGVKVLRRDGKYTDFNFGFENDIITSNAKLPYDTEPEDAKYITVSMRRITMEDLEVTKYKEDKKKVILERNEKVCKVLGLLHKAWLKVSETINEEADDHSDKFELTKTDIFSYAQTMRNASKEERADRKSHPTMEKVNGKWKIPLAEPIYRFRVQCVKGDKLGWYHKERGHQFVVFDLRKSTAKKPAVAKLKKGGKYVHLTAGNAHHFIRYMSLITGTWNVDSCCASSQGQSCMNKFRKLFVWPHPKIKRDLIKAEEIDAAKDLGVEFNSDDEVDLDEVSDSDEEEKKKRKGKGKKSGKKIKTREADSDEDLDDDEEAYDEDDVDDEPEENSADSDEEKEVVDDSDSGDEEEVSSGKSPKKRGVPSRRGRRSKK